jgi:hypothetical protein
MQKSHRWCLLTAILVSISLLVLPRPAATDVGRPHNPHFPQPLLLAPNVAFWKQIYTAYGVGDFVLHDRDRLDVVYGVVRIKNATSQAGAAAVAEPEIQRMRAKYNDILTRLAAGAAPEELGAEGGVVAQTWGCPCPPEVLRRAGENIRVQQGLREKVDEGLHRASKLLPRILAILRQHQVPAELAALPMVESTFNPAAYSKAGAAGLWQFIRSTGKQYSLISRKRDDRRDPVRATEAAAHLLRNNYEALGSWPLAIVAYNHGHAGIRAASTQVGSTAIEDIVARYNGPRFGFASKNFYAEFLAALDVVHPLLGLQGTPLDAKSRQRIPQQVAFPVQRPLAPVLVPPAPPAAAAPVEVETPIAPSVPPAEEELPIEMSGPPADPSLGEQPIAMQQVSVVSDLPGAPTDTSSGSTDTPPPASADAPAHDTAPPDVPETEAPEPVSP